MLNSVSGVSFKGDVTPAQNTQDLISAPSQFSASLADAPVDSFEKVGEEKKRSKAPVVIGGLLALAAATYIGLGIAVGKGKLKKVEGTDLKFMEKAQNWAHAVGDNAKSVWNKVTGWFGKKGAEEATSNVATTGEQAAGNATNATT